MKKISTVKKSQTNRRASVVAAIAQNRAKTLLANQQRAFCGCGCY